MPWDYFSDGFEVRSFFNNDEIKQIRSFCHSWLQSIFAVQSFELDEIEFYHTWPQELTQWHDKFFTAANRHCIPPEAIQKILLCNSEIRQVVSDVTGKFEVWDEGLGWLAFRLVRPRPWTDGYALSCKEWGPGNQLLSFCFPVLQTNSMHYLGCVRGSHLENFSAVADTSGKFCRDELRLDPIKHKVSVYYPKMLVGDGLFFGSRLLHCEEPSSETKFTRLNLEVRFVI